MAKQINKLANCNVYMDGQNFVGRASEVNLPDITHKTTEYKGLGMIGAVDLPVAIDKMEATFKWTSVYADAAIAVADPRKQHLVQVRGNLETHDSSGLVSEVPVVAEIGGRFTKPGALQFKQDENTMPESTMTAHFFKLFIDGQVITEIDVLENIFTVNGVDLLATFRTNLGL